LKNTAVCSRTIFFADRFAVAAAQRENAVIMTGDPEFKNLDKFVKIDWLSQ
jgi:hypothetical protein